MYKKDRDKITFPAQLLSGKNSVASNRSRANSSAAPNVSQESSDDSEWDIMISYSHCDKEFMQKLREKLQESGFTVWVDTQGIDTGDNFLSEIGKAIMGSKVFLPIISKDQINSRYCRDELSFAYISDKPIIPVGLLTFVEVKSEMPTGMRLQLASYEWIRFDDCTDNEGSMLLGTDDEFAIKFAILRDTLNSIIAVNVSESKEDDPEVTIRMREAKKFNRMKSQHSIELSKQQDFWDRHFPDNLQVNWNEFLAKLLEDFGEDLDSSYNKSDLEWLVKNLKREMNVSLDGILLRTEYMTFLQSQTVHSKNFHNTGSSRVHFLERINDYAMETFAVRDVFNIESSVRVDAIENLGKFRSQAVIEALLDLLSDEDVNVRTVALISLARTGKNSDFIVRRVCECLKDNDRLVRESACLALGRLRCSGPTEEYVVPLILNTWRNDVISTVRDSAELALKGLNSESAKLAIKMTTLLQKEIKLLKE